MPGLRSDRRSFGLSESSCMRTKVNNTLAVRSSVYLVSHKLLLIYVDALAALLRPFSNVYTINIYIYMFIYTNCFFENSRIINNNININIK